MLSIKVPKCCKECKSLGEYPWVAGSCKFYCHMKAIEPVNQCQDISTIYIDPETRPDWCPMIDVQKSLQALDPKKKEAVEMVIRGLAIIFDAENLLEGTEDA